MLSRRNFLGASASFTLASRVSRPAAAQTPAAQPGRRQPGRRRMIVDAQVHLWKAETPDWQWVPGMKPQLPEPFTIERLVPLMDEAGVDRVVVVPPSWPGDRNDYALEAARRYPDRFRVMGRIPLKNPRSADLLPKWKEQPGMLGIRLTFLRGAGAWLADGTADWFWPAAEKAGLPVMFLAPGNMPAFIPIAERHPQLTLIIDHMALSTEVANDKKIPEAIEQTVALAKFPNVSVKLSGTPTVSSEPYPFRDMKEHLKRCFEAFGPRRCYWGTDMTNSFAKATYKQRITHFTEELDFLSEADKDWVMGRAILERIWNT
ncbi:MAG: amidohydrolase family protein [Xanthobacteraceae bacterium]